MGGAVRTIELAKPHNIGHVAKWQVRRLVTEMFHGARIKQLLLCTRRIQTILQHLQFYTIKTDKLK